MNKLIREVAAFSLALIGLYVLIVPDYSDKGLIVGGMMLWLSLRMR